MPRKGMSSIFYHSPRHKGSTSAAKTTSSPLNSRTLYSFSNSMMEETLTAAEEMITKWDPEASTFAKVTSLFHESRREAKDFIKIVRDLQRAMQFIASQDSNSAELVRAQNLMQIAMKRLQKELYQILSTNRAHLDPESISGRSSEDRSGRTSVSASDFDEADDEDEDENQVGDSISEVEKVSALARSDLKTIADCMIFTGYGKEFVQIYKIIRKSIVDEGLYRLGVERLSPKKAQKLDWEVLDLKIKNWLNAIKIAVKTLFTGERILCDHVFASSDFIRDSCFNEISREGAMTLFQFPQLVVKGKKSPQKLFRSLDLYDSIANLWQEIESIFSSESTSVVRSEALSSLIKLSESIRGMLSELETTIQKDSSKSLPHGGGIHPLTRQAMDDFCLLADYTGPLSDILSADDPSPSAPQSYDNAVPLRFAWLILVLLCKLDGKADRYKDAAVSYLFLANNLHHVLTKVRTSNLKIILGDDWIAAHEEKLKLYAANYVKMGWNRVVSTLPTADDSGEISSVSMEEARRCLERFNAGFEATYRSQGSWVVPDTKLRDEIKLAICMSIGPVYRAFLDKFGGAFVGSGLVRYDTGDLSNYISDLFYGTGVSGSSSTSNSSTATSNKRSSWLR